MAIYISGGVPLSWEDARAKVRGDLWRPDGIPNDVVDRALHASLLDLEGEARWLWLENITGGLTVDGDTDNLTIPPSVGSITALSLRYGSYLDPLGLAPLATIRSLSQISPGQPCMYALTDGLIYFDTIVPAGTEFEMVFSARTPEYLSDAIDAPNATLYRFQQVVIAGACALVALTFLKNSDEAARQQAYYDTRVTRMLERESQQRSDASTGGVVPDTGYSVAAFGYGGN